MKDFWYTAAPYLQGHPKRVAPGTILELTKRLAKTRKSMGTALRILLSSPGAVIEEWFTREEVKAALGCYSVASMGSLDEPGSGIVLSVMAVMHHWGARRPVGGNGAFTTTGAGFGAGGGGAGADARSTAGGTPARPCCWPCCWPCRRCSSSASDAFRHAAIATISATVAIVPAKNTR